MGSGIAFAAALAAVAIQSSTVIASSKAINSTSWQLYEPDTKWVVDFDDQRCFASRRFRSPSETLIFGISPWPMFDWAKVVVEKPGDVDGIIPVNGKVSIDGGKPYDVVMFAADSANVGKIIYSFTLPGAAIEELKAGKRAQIQSSQLSADIPLSSLAPVFSKLNECIPLLLEHWGHSKEKQALQATYPSRRGLPFRVDDYPGSAIRRGAVGVVEALVDVSVDGRVLTCKVIRSSGHKDLDSKTCEMMLKRGRFNPGLDRNGKAMESPYLQSINWIMPN